MARSRHSQAYDRLAMIAGERVGLEKITPEDVAKNPDAAAVRMELWGDYETVLRDEQTYTLEAVVNWLAEQGCKASRSAVGRDRKALLSRERSIVTAAARAKAVTDMVAKGGYNDTDIFAAGRLKAGQLIFEALCELGPDALDDLTPGNIIKMVKALSELGKSDAQVNLLKQKVTEMKRAFDAAVAATQAGKSKGASGTLTAEQIAEIRRATFGEVA